MKELRFKYSNQTMIFLGSDDEEIAEKVAAWAVQAGPNRLNSKEKALPFVQKSAYNKSDVPKGARLGIKSMARARGQKKPANYLAAASAAFHHAVGQIADRDTVLERARICSGYGGAEKCPHMRKVQGGACGPR